MSPKKHQEDDEIEVEPEEEEPEEEKEEKESDSGGGNDARMKLVETVVNTPEAQLSSMTNIQPNLVTPMAMTETYEKLVDILKKLTGRYQTWMGQHQKWIDSMKSRDYNCVSQKEDFVCPLCIADGVNEEDAKYKGEEAHRINFEGVWCKGIIGPQVYIDVKKDMPLCFDHAIKMVERVQWGPPVTDVEIKMMDEEDAKISVQLTKVYRMSVYKHRRSVGGLHRMAVVDLSKEQMAMESQDIEETKPDYTD